MHTTIRRFWRHFHDLPEEIQRLAVENYKLLEDDPRHPSLRFKKVGVYWSARVGRTYRAVAVESQSGYVWVWIGHHSEYDRFINGK